jgi:hypothetical protein
MICVVIRRLLIFEHLHQVLNLDGVRSGWEVTRLLLLRCHESSSTVTAFSRLIVAAGLAFCTFLLQL